MKNRFIFQLTIGVFVLLISFSASAQSATNLYWVRYFNQLHFNKKWSWQNEFDERRSIQPDYQRQFIIHSFANLKISPKTDLAIGTSGSWVTNSNSLTVPEIRLFQSVIAKVATWGKNDIHVRVRVEERFFHNTDSEKKYLTDGHNFKLRSRYRIQFQRTSPNGKWSVRLSDEIMYHTDNSDAWKFDQNRVYVGVERRFSKQISLEMGYLLLHASSNDQIIYSNILRTTLYHRINL